MPQISAPYTSLHSWTIIMGTSSKVQGQYLQLQPLQNFHKFTFYI